MGKLNCPLLFSNWLTMNGAENLWNAPGGTNGFGPSVGFTGRMLFSANAQVGAGSERIVPGGAGGGSVRQGTIAAGLIADRPPIIAVCAAVGAKMLLLV